MRITMRVAAALGAFLSAGFLQAGAQCRLMGTITDSAGVPIEGAAIVITTPKLGMFKLVLKTDAKGKYSTIMNDCTMPYHVSVEKEGYVSYGEDKKIPINDMGTVDAKLLKASEGKAAPGAAPAAAPASSGNEQAVLAFNAGVEAVNAGDKAGAEAKFLEAVKKNPDLPNGWSALSALAYEKKDWAKAVEYGEKAVDLDPTLTNLYPMLAESSKNMGDKKGAADWTAKYAEANPDSPEILYNKGIQFYNKGKMKEAEEALTKAVEAKPEFANAQFYLGMSSFNLNHKASAKEHLQKYLELEPNGKEAATVKEILPTLK